MKKWNRLLARTHALILYISIWIFDFGPVELPGPSRNGPQSDISFYFYLRTLFLLHKTQPKMTENSDCVLIILFFKWKNLKSVSNNRARVKIITHKQLKLT